MKMPFGRFKGMHLSVVPSDYIEWLIRQNEAQNEEYRDELERRAREGVSPPTIGDEIPY